MVKGIENLVNQGAMIYNPMMGKRKKKNKNRLPVFDSDDDFLKEFEKESHKKIRKESKDNKNVHITDRHGVTILDSQLPYQGCNEDGNDLDFATLLAQSYKSGILKRAGKPENPLPVKKRIKRYPPVELELDLHGFTSTGAQIKARSFISSCREQGFFTIRIIVGKGLHSELGAVLPDVVEDVVKEMKSQGHILFYEWDKKKKIRSGALIVYIRQFD